MGLVAVSLVAVGLEGSEEAACAVGDGLGGLKCCVESAGSSLGPG